MIEDKSQFISLKAQDGRVVMFRVNDKSKIIGLCNIRIIPTIYIENVLLVNGLIHNLLSIS